ncbi:MAG: hypothetical protein ACTSYF_07010, partial [Promethearchaeota archaeon]
DIEYLKEGFRDIKYQLQEHRQLFDSIKEIKREFIDIKNIINPIELNEMRSWINNADGLLDKLLLQIKRSGNSEINIEDLREEPMRS